MTTVTGIADRATERLPYGSHSTNGGPPAASRGPSVLAVVGIAFVVGVAVAKFLDWRAHAHPRD
ncbi:MAG TPA: hypothetical protein VIU86_01040 [Gaiellaceae bacterium]